MGMEMVAIVMMVMGMGGRGYCNGDSYGVKDRSIDVLNEMQSFCIRFRKSQGLVLYPHIACE